MLGPFKFNLSKWSIQFRSFFKWKSLTKKERQKTKEIKQVKKIQDCGVARINTDKIHSPWELFTCWLEESQRNGMAKPLVFSLATVTRAGCLSNRYITVRDWKNDGIVFMGNCNSLKMSTLNDNPIAAMVCHWPYVDNKSRHICRSIRIEGGVEKLPRAELKVYYDALSREAKISTHVGQQGCSIAWKDIKCKFEELAKKFEYEDCQIRMPDHMVGYKVVPKWFDFWYSYDNLMADRIVFELRKGKWCMDRVLSL